LQLLKSSQIHLAVQNEIANWELVEVDEDDDTTCDICNKSITSFLEFYGSNGGGKSAIHKVCSWACFSKNIRFIKQNEWEGAVKNDALLDINAGTEN
jgi:hypothetical protein